MRAGFDKQVLQAPPRLWDYHLLHFCLLHTLFVHLGQGQLLIKMNNISLATSCLQCKVARSLKVPSLFNYVSKTRWDFL